jgi:Na+-transporting NADH:ubiquinone oxidoreductase subunit C
MKEFSSKYIFGFASAMVIIVAVFLSLAATMLQPRQLKNLEVDKKKSMLESIRVQSTAETAEEMYDKFITESFVLNSEGQVVEGVDAFDVDLRVEQRKPLDQQYLPVFRAHSEDGDSLIILPLQGKGLWGPIWGYISLRSDMNTIYGVTFDHKAETPGLGAEINTSWFEDMFTDKRIFEGEKFTSVEVRKGGAREDNPHAVDGISGGTITSKGLERMLEEGLGKYNEYLLKNKS